MINVMIVDDLVSDRIALQTIVSQFKNLDISIQEVFSSGYDALDSMSAALPDIVICDLDMPGMNGFELTKEIKKRHATVKVVFCSHYKDFEYARNALYLDNYGYVTKPINPDELYATLQDTINYINKEKIRSDEETALLDAFEKNRPLMQNQFLKDLLFAQYQSKDDLLKHFSFWGLPEPNAPFRVILIEVDDYHNLSSDLTIERRHLIATRIHNTLSNLLPANSSAVCQLDESQFAVLLIGTDQMISEDASNQILTCFQKSDISLTMSVSDVGTTLEKIPQLLEQCYYALRFKYSLGKGRIIFYTDLKQNAPLPQKDLNRIQQDITFFVNSKDMDSLTEYLRQLFEQGESNVDPKSCKKLGFDIAVCLQNIMLENRLTFEDIVQNEFIWDRIYKSETLEDTKEYLLSVAERCIQAIAQISEQKNALLAQQVKRLVYTSDLKTISISSIANTLHYSSDYLNYLFKKTTDETISEFIIKYRIEMAKELLEDPSLKLYQIAEQLGYSHTFYFTNIFKRYVGISPREYRDATLLAKSEEGDSK